MSKSRDIVAIGECLVEFNEVAPQRYEQDYAGDVLNTLTMASRLGLSAGLVSAMGEDPFVDGLRSVLDEERIDLTMCPALEGRANGVYFVMHSGRAGRPSFHFLRKYSAATACLSHVDREQLLAYLRDTRSILFSGIPLAVFEACETLIEILEAVASETEVYFDLNVRPALWSRVDDLIELLPRLARFVKVLFITNDDDRHLFGERSLREALAALSALGFSRIVYRQGKDPVLLYAMGKVHEIPVVQHVKVVDPTGAGDAFNAGFIAGVLSGLPLEDAVKMGSAAAAAILGERGGRAKLATRETVQAIYTKLIDARTAV